jgi:LysM repeat protein
MNAGQLNYKSVFLGLLVGVLTTSHAAGNQLDSLRLEVSEAGSVVSHQVEPKETLYSLARRYGTTIADIVAQNPGAENGLDIGEVLMIPYTRENSRITHIVQEGETLYSISRKYAVSLALLQEWNDLSSTDLKLGQPLKIYPTESTSIKDEIQEKSGTAHVVEAGETLFAISRKYDVPVRKLRKWNDLDGNDISIGQKLILEDPDQKANIPEEEPETPVLNPVVSLEPADKAAPVDMEKKATPDTIYVNYRNPTKKVDNASGFESIVEQGIAEVIEDNTDTRKYLALHREAPVGTLMQVRNEETGLRVFVRVIGHLPDTGVNESILIKISKPAFDRLGATNKRFRVVTSYVP